MTIDDGDSGDVWQCAFDADNGKIWFGKNNTWDNNANPALGSNESYASIPSSKWAPITCSYSDSNSENYVQNFGQDDTFAGRITAQGNADENGHGVFKYAPPTGFLALCSANLPISADIDPAQTDDDYPGKLFNVVTYTGNGSTRTLTGLGFQPDLVWIKSRSNANSNELYDSSRGVTKRLRSDTYDAEDTRSSELTGFTSDGFSLGSSTYGGTNYNSYTYVAWCWRLNGGTTVSNTTGDINSTTQANDKTGLSIVTYTGNGSQGQTIGHGLTKAPEMVWFKNRDYGTRGTNMDWIVTLADQAGSPFDGKVDIKESLNLNNNGAIQAFFGNGSSSYDGPNFTSSVFSVPNNGNAPYWFNGSGDDYVAYCWHSVEGFSKFGMYEGNGNDDNAFVYTGFRPRLIFIKRIDSSAHWYAYDTARSTFNPVDDYIEWSDTDAEETNYQYQKYDFLSNGFKVRGSNNIGGASGGTYLYGAWGDVPFKYNNTF
jgi:hypothetical protein